jgi:hypothetical protein
MKKRSRVTAKTPKSSKQDAPPGYPDGDYVKCSCGRVITRADKWQAVACLACDEWHPRLSEPFRPLSRQATGATGATGAEYPTGMTGPTGSSSDPVNHPAHYTSHPSGVEVIVITEHLSFCVGNAVKYLLRAEYKGKQLEDLAKARWYIDREIKRLGKGKRTC